MKQHFACVEQSTGTTVVYREVKILMTLQNMSLTDRKLSVLSFSLKNSGYDGEHCFPSRPRGNSFPVTSCTVSHIPSCSCLYPHGVSWSLDRKGGGIIPWSSFCRVESL